MGLARSSVMSDAEWAAMPDQRTAPTVTTTESPAITKQTTTNVAGVAGVARVVEYAIDAPERLRLAQEMNSFITRMGSYDASSLAVASMYEDEDEYAGYVLRLLNVVKNLKGYERRFIWATHAVTRVAINALIKRIGAQLRDEMGSGGEDVLRNVLLGTSLALQTSHLVGEVDGYDVELYDFLLEPWQSVDEYLDHPLDGCESP